MVTNPDMLHKGILPHHTKWVKLFENLKYVVINAELATALTGKPVEWIQESGAPRGDLYLMALWPPAASYGRVGPC